MIIDELEPPVESIQEAAAKQITRHFLDNPKVFMLLAPSLLTVLKGDKYSKRSQIGGEEFVPIGCYEGKRGRLIYTFKPKGVTDFTVAELNHEDAKKAFGNVFETHLKGSPGGNVEQLAKDMRKSHADAAEAIKNAEKGGVYANIGWGDF